MARKKTCLGGGWVQRSQQTDSSTTWPVLQPHPSNRLWSLRRCATILPTSYSSLPSASLTSVPWQQNRAAPRDSLTFPATQVRWQETPVPVPSALRTPEVSASVSLAAHLSFALQLHTMADVSSAKSPALRITTLYSIQANPLHHTVRPTGYI